MMPGSENLNILYIASHGFAVRMLLQTDLLTKLQQNGLRVGLVTMDASDPSVAEYCLNNGIKNIGFNVKADKWMPYKELFRRYMLEKVKQNPALYEKHLRLVDQARTSRSMRNRLRLANIASGISRYLPFGRIVYQKIEKKQLHNDEADLLIRKYNPSIVISTVPVSVMEATILYAAAKKNVRTVTQILSWDNITCKGHFRMLSADFIVWGRIMKEELQRYYGIKPRNIYECGVPHFDLHFKNREELKGKAKGDYLLFAMSSPYFAPREIDIVESIAKWIEEDKWPGLKFVVRPHPQNVIGNMADLTWLGRLKHIESAKVKVDYPQINNESGIHWSMKQSDMPEMSLLIANAAAVINSGSTMSIDALCYLKPVIVTAFDNEEELPWHLSIKRAMEYEHFRNIIDSGGVAKTNNYQELQDAISEAINNPKARMEKMKSILFDEVGIDDGRATERVVEVLQKMANSPLLN
ncbi:MAG: hypothetical protein JST95_09445 [Bacteroidetes bacterium]|nr:hypothetical protein [Bacteroidota bacterium]